MSMGNELYLLLKGQAEGRLTVRQDDELRKRLGMLFKDVAADSLQGGGGGWLLPDRRYLRLDASNDPVTGALEISTSTLPQLTLTGGAGTDVVHRFRQSGAGGTAAFSGTALVFTTDTPNDWVVAGGGTIQTTAEVASDSKWAAGVTLSDTTPTAYFYAAIPAGSHITVGAVIRSISVTVIKRNQVEPTFRPILDAGVYMFLSGVAQGADHSSASVWPTTFQNVTYTWEANTIGSITASSVNNGNVKFGIRCARDVVSALDGLANIDFISITITYGASWEIGIDASAGKLALGVEGWTSPVYIGEDGQITIPVATGTSPLSVSSTTVNTNFNADLLDGYHAADLPYVDISGTPAANQLAYWTDADTIAGDALITRFSDATNQKLIIKGADTVYKGLFFQDTTSSEEWVWSHRIGSVSNNFELYYSPNGSSYTRAWYWDISGNALSPFTVGAKLESAAGIRLDPNAATGNFTLSLSPANLTAARRVTFPDADLTVTGGGTLALGGFTATMPKTGTLVTGTGTAGRISEWVTDVNTLQASTLAKTGAGVLTLSAAGAYTLTIPATGTPALLDINNAPVTGIGFGAAPTANRYFYISKAFTLTSGEGSALMSICTASPASASTGDFRGATLYVSSGTDQNIATMRGLFGYVQHLGTGIVTSVESLFFAASNNAAGTITSLTGINVGATQAGTGTVGTAYAGLFTVTNTNVVGGAISIAYGVYSKYVHTGAGTTTNAFLYRGTMTLSAGAVTNAYGLYLDNISIGGTTNYAIYTNAGLNRFGDQLAIAGSADRSQLVVTGFTTQAVATPMTQFTRNDVTAGISAMLGLTALGSGANGDGGSILYNGKSSTTAAQAMGLDQWLWVNATHASRTARRVFNVYDTAVREALRIEASGTAAMIGFLGANAVVRPTALTTALTTVTCTAPGTPDYAIQDLAAGGYGFVTADEAQSTIKVIANLQTRVGELETKLQSLGLLT